MRIDGVGYKKNIMSVITGFLSEENGTIIFTKNKGGYHESSAALLTKEQIATNRLINKFVGVIQPEKELFRFSKSDIIKVENTPVDSTEYGGKKYYTRLIKVETEGGSYEFQYGTTQEESLRNFDEIFGIHA